MIYQASFNQGVAVDLQGIIAFYETKSGTALADAFYQELIQRIDQVLENPQQFPFSTGDRRRVNLRRFPYHILYRIELGVVRILVLRHHHQDPKYGTRRS